MLGVVNYEMLSNTNSTINQGTRLLPSDFASAYSFTFDYVREGLLTRSRLLLLASAQLHMSQTNFLAANSDESFTATSRSVNTRLGLGFKLFQLGKLDLQALAFGGFYYGQISLDYSTLSSAPRDPITLAETSNRSFNQFGPSISGGLRVSYELNNYIDLELGGAYSQVFFNQLSIRSIDIATGLSIRI